MTSSGKVRIYELSRDLGLDNKDVLDAAEKLSIAARSHSSSISDDEASRIRALLIKANGSAAGAARASVAPVPAAPAKAILSVKKASAEAAPPAPPAARAVVSSPAAPIAPPSRPSPESRAAPCLPRSEALPMAGPMRAHHIRITTTHTQARRASYGQHPLQHRHLKASTPVPSIRNSGDPPVV